jgi:hypothetical protein
MVLKCRHCLFTDDVLHLRRATAPPIRIDNQHKKRLGSSVFSVSTAIFYMFYWLNNNNQTDQGDDIEGWDGEGLDGER